MTKKNCSSFLVKLLYFIVGFLLGFIVYKYWVATPKVEAIQQNCELTTPCIASTCGTTEGTQNQQCTTYEYADGICPTNYHWQNNGNWNERCHRDYIWMHPEHKAPTGCPATYEKVGDSCRKSIVNNTEVKCDNAEIIACECEWVWGDCSASCGGGTQVGYLRGEGCSNEEDTRECNTQACFKADAFTPAGPPPEPMCKDLGGYVPTITEVSRVDSDTIKACWTSPSENADAYLIWYGTNKNNLPWNTVVKGLCTEINDVPQGHIWLKVAAKSEGCVGNFSITTDP